MSSTITVAPRRELNTFEYSLSNKINSSAIPHTLGVFLIKSLISSVIFLGLTLVIGKNVALPILLAFKYSITYFASFSFFVTIFCTELPRAISIAVSYFCGTFISLATTFINLPANVELDLASCNIFLIDA